ncbi:hypothetical protein SESBI_02034 [Sesbania bispinosa]|nr:hypothetical protein SESBI_02034 [Sesbania bispinosa]
MLQPGDVLFSSSVAFSSTKRSDALLRYSVAKAPSLDLGPSLLRSRIATEEFPWSPICFVSKSFHPNGWAEWVDHVFTTDEPFVDIWIFGSTLELQNSFLFMSWGEFTPTLEGVAILLKLPMFGDFDLSATVLDCHIAEMTKSLKVATLESAKHSREKLALRRFHQGADARLPLASIYLGSLYGRLDQLQEQMYSSYGHFSVNSCIDYVFIQMFLYERFPDYGPVRRIPKLLVGDSSPPEYRVQGWSLGCPRQPLINLIDDEVSFVFRPYTSSFFSGVEGVDRIYLEPVFSTRNNKGSQIEGVFDFWLLYVRPQVLPGFIMTDIVGIIGGTLFPFSYSPSRVCRQFGLDQPPLPLELDLLPVHEAMKAVLFEEWQCLPPFDSALFVPPGRVGCVLDEWVIIRGVSMPL